MKEDEIRRMVSSSKQLAEQQIAGIVKQAHKKSDQIFDREIERLEALSKVNKNIRSEELEYFKKQRTSLTDIIDSANLRLDALRVIVGI